jgi:hypothetical protein
MARTKLRKHARQIRGHAAAAAAAVHIRRAIHAILVLAKIVPFAPPRIRKHSVCFDNQLELFLIAALNKEKTKKGHNPLYYWRRHTNKKRKEKRDREGGGGKRLAPCLDDA